MSKSLVHSEQRENSASRGRGNPDKIIAHQWKAGESGNPGGRPKKKLLTEIYEEILRGNDDEDEPSDSDTRPARLRAGERSGVRLSFPRSTLTIATGKNPNPPAELIHGFFNMAQIGFVAIVGLIGGKTLQGLDKNGTNEPNRENAWQATEFSEISKSLRASPLQLRNDPSGPKPKLPGIRLDQATYFSTRTYDNFVSIFVVAPTFQFLLLALASWLER